MYRDIVASVGPTAIAFHVADSFYNYQSGVYRQPNCDMRVNHAMLLVGYGTDPVHGDYFKVKNSWGMFSKNFLMISVFFKNDFHIF